MGKGIRTAAVAIAVASLALVACGEKTIKADRAADTVTNVVEEKTGFKPTDMSCPEDVKAEVGASFDCHFTGPEGPYVASVKITKIDGDDAIFQVNSRRAN